MEWRAQEPPALPQANPATEFEREVAYKAGISLEPTVQAAGASVTSEQGEPRFRIEGRCRRFSSGRLASTTGRRTSPCRSH